MGRPPKEFQAFRTLTDRLLAVPKETLDKRLKEHREAPPVGAKRGPKPKTSGVSSSAVGREDT
jgi:hypothetical protein